MMSLVCLQLPEVVQDVLRVTCDEEEMCLGNVFQEVSLHEIYMYMHMHMHMHIIQ